MHPAMRHIVLLLVLGMSVSFLAHGQSAAQTEPAAACTGADCPATSDTNTSATGDKPPPKPKTIADFTKGKVKIDGLFPIWRDPVSGAVHLELTAEQLKQQYIYYNFVRNGVSGLLAQLGDLRFAGQIGDNFAVRFRHRFNRVDIIRQNLAYVIDADSPLRRAQGINAGDSLMASMAVVARDEDGGRLIVAANPLFSGTDLFRIGNASPLLGILGATPTLSKTKSSILDVRNYPANSAVISEYVFDFKSGPAPITVELQHNLVAMPPEGFTPRRADPRVGLFTLQRTNLSALDRSPVDDVIRRWRLVKSDPAAGLSPPVKPIVFWIQNSTPIEYRDTIKTAAELWNAVFERAGFKNVVQVRVQPDDADWDAGDVRYNVIQWIASPVPLFNGYGPTVVDPRTGEIIGADIVLEHMGLQTQHRLQRALAPVQPTTAAMLMDDGAHHDCALSSALQGALALALAQVAAADGPGASDPRTIDQLVRQRLIYLVMHEVGHALGLTHNMKGSTYRSLAELKAGLPADQPITGSVMDYPATLLWPGMTMTGAIFPQLPGPYDEWAIRFAYDPVMDDPAARLQLLARAGQPGYAYGVDAEDMRSTGRGIDPTNIPYDMSSDPVGFAAEHMTLIRSLQAGLPRGIGNAPHDLDAFVETHEMLMLLYRQQIIAVSRQIGGVFDRRDLVTSGGAVGPLLQPVPAVDQKRAIATINAALLAPGAMPFASDYVSSLVRTRRGQSPVRVTSIDEDVNQIQQLVLDHVFHVETLGRLATLPPEDGNWSVDTMFDSMTTAIFDADLQGSASGRRLALQQRYVAMLIGAMDIKAARMKPFRGTMMRQVKAIDRRLAGAAQRGDVASKAARAALRHDIARALDPSA